MTTTNSTDEFSLDAVVDRLRGSGIAAYVEQTGGGVATVYAGEPYRDPADPDWGDRYPAVAGPGWFNGPGWTDGRGSVYEFYVGPDDDGTDLGAVATLPENETDPVTWIAERISALVRHDG